MPIIYKWNCYSLICVGKLIGRPYIRLDLEADAAGRYNHPAISLSLSFFLFSFSFWIGIEIYLTIDLPNNHQFKEIEVQEMSTSPGNGDANWWMEALDSCRVQIPQKSQAQHASLYRCIGYDGGAWPRMCCGILLSYHTPLLHVFLPLLLQRSFACYPPGSQLLLECLIEPNEQKQ